MDQFLEEIVTPKSRVLARISNVFFSIFMVVFGFMGLMELSLLFSGEITLPTVITTLVCIGVAVGSYYMKDRMLVEYEYTYTAGELDFDKVIAGKRRAHVVSLNVRDIVQIASVEDATYHNASRTPDAKKYNMVLNSDSIQHYMLFNKGGRKGLLVFEPSRDFLQMMRSGLGRDKDRISIDERVASRPGYQTSRRERDDIES